MLSVLIYQNMFWFGVVWPQRLLVWTPSLVPKDSLIPKQINEAQRCFYHSCSNFFFSRRLYENKYRQPFRQKGNLCQTPSYSWAAEQRWKEAQSSYSKEFPLFNHHMIVDYFWLWPDLSLQPPIHPFFRLENYNIFRWCLVLIYIWWEALARLYKKLIDFESVGQRFINYLSR